MISEKHLLMKQWLFEVRKDIIQMMHQELRIEAKTDRTDIVTIVDKTVQDFLVKKINQHFPEDAILAEENGMDTTAIDLPAVWVIDPIDGTLNFAVQHDNFAVLVGYFEQGVGQFGFIFDVMKNKLFFGGEKYGVYLNDQPLALNPATDISDGLIGVNASMYRQNIHQVAEVAKQTLGVRIIGSAGLEFCALLEGKIIGYISKISPWDYASGVILANCFGFIASDLEGNPLKYAGRQYFMIFHKTVYPEVLSILNNEL